MITLELSQEQVNQISVALTLYVSTFERMGISVSSMPVTQGLVSKFMDLTINAK